MDKPRRPVASSAEEENATSEAAMAMFERDKMYGHRARIGYTSPPLTTEVFPYEFYKIVPEGVSLVITSLAIVVRSTAEVDQSYDISMRAAREMAAAGCDIVVLGGVPINLSRGFQNAQAMIDDLEAQLGIKISTSQRAQTRAAKTLGARKMVMAHPYAESDTDRIAGNADHFDCEVVGAKAWGSPFNQVGRIPRDAALRMGRELLRAHPDADTILMPSPHWPTIEAIEPLEREFGVNVMTALQVIVWDALRRVGVNDKIDRLRPSFPGLLIEARRTRHPGEAICAVVSGCRPQRPAAHHVTSLTASQPMSAQRSPFICNEAGDLVVARDDVLRRRGGLHEELADGLGVDRARIDAQLLRAGEIVGILGHRHEGILQGLGAVGRTPGGATKGTAMKNGCSANCSSARSFGSLISSRPVGTSASSGSRVSARKLHERAHEVIAPELRLARLQRAETDTPGHRLRRAAWQGISVRRPNSRARSSN